MLFSLSLNLKYQNTPNGLGRLIETVGDDGDAFKMIYLLRHLHSFRRRFTNCRGTCYLISSLNHATSYRTV